MRFCFAQGSCTHLLGAGSAYSLAQDIAPTSQQKAILHHLFLQTPTFYGATRAPMLVTRNADSFQLGIPSNHWEAEVKAWFQFLLAVTQTTIPYLAAGPGIVRSDFDQLVEPLAWPGLCHSQRMGAPDGYSNINLFGLVVVVALSGIIILTNLSLVPTLKYLHRRGLLSSLRMQSWIQESLLQVQRKAYEGAGYSEWLFLDADVPRIMDDVHIPGLGTGLFRARTDRRLPGDHDGRRPEGSLSPNTSHPRPPLRSPSHPHFFLSFADFHSRRRKTFHYVSSSIGAVAFHRDVLGLQHQDHGFCWWV